MDVLVLGAGALGMACAHQLAVSGHTVTVLDRGQVAGGTTAFAAGILSLGLVDAHDRHLTRMTMEGLTLLDREHPVSGADTGPLLHRPGSFIVAPPGAETAAVWEIAKGLAAMDATHGFVEPTEWAEAMASRGMTVHVDDVTTVLSLPEDAWALSTEGTQTLARAAKALGVRMRTGADVAGLVREGGKVTGAVMSDGRPLMADAVVVAFGPWSRPFLDRIGLRLPCRAYRTHAAVLRTTAPMDAPIVHDTALGFYLRPEGPDHLLVGNGTRTEPTDPEGFTNDAENWFLEGIAERVPRRFPALAEASLQNAWRGVLAGVPDRRPLVGAHPDAPGLWLCTGDNGFGFMRSYALGACLAAAVSAEGPPEGLPQDTLAWMDPARFWPDPPSEFPVMEGFALVPEKTARG